MERKSSIETQPKLVIPEHYFASYATFLYPVDPASFHEIITFLQQNEFIFSYRPELQCIAGVLFSFHQYELILQSFKKKRLYIGAPKTSSRYPIIFFDKANIDFSSPQIVAVYRAFQHQLPPGIYILDENGENAVKNGRLTKMNPSDLENFLSTLTPPEIPIPPPIKLNEEEIPPGYILFSIDHNYSTNRVSNPYEALKMASLIYSIWQELLQKFEKSYAFPRFLLNITGDSLELLIPPLDLGIIQGTLLKYNNLYGLPFKSTATEVQFEISALTFPSSSRIRRIALTTPSLSTALTEISRLQQFHKKTQFPSGIIVMSEDITPPPPQSPFLPYSSHHDGHNI